MSRQYRVRIDRGHGVRTGWGFEPNLLKSLRAFHYAVSIERWYGARLLRVSRPGAGILHALLVRDGRAVTVCLERR